jgi:hypothetical protein
MNEEEFFSNLVCRIDNGKSNLGFFLLLNKIFSAKVC